MSSNQWSDNRPLSPHVQIWRWHWTMAASIAHRVSGVALYFGMFLLAAWVVALSLPVQADGLAPECFTLIHDFVGSVFGQVIMTLWAAAALFHALNGFRYLMWSGPKIGFDPKVASRWSVFNFVIAVLGAGGIWFAAFGS